MRERSQRDAAAAAARIRRALAAADAAAAQPREHSQRAPPKGRVLVMGDPQAPLGSVLAILERAGALAESGWLRDGVHLVSIGDHFDWGRPEDRPMVESDGLRLLAWLAAHPPQQVSVMLGNHDLARVGELVGFDAAGFGAARAAGDHAYRGAAAGAAAERAFLERHPALPSAEAIARDFSGFCPAQRSLITLLLRARRLRAALAFGDGVLLHHAGLTTHDLDAAGAPREGAEAIARRLDVCLDAAVEAWDGRSPFGIPGLHQPGSAALGEARGAFSQRPAHPEHSSPRGFEGPLRRRFDPRRAPAGLTQVVGHTGDAKCRKTLGPWVSGPAAAPGALRHLLLDRERPVYAAGLPPSGSAGQTRFVFTDGGMSRCPPERYQLLELSAITDA